MIAEAFERAGLDESRVLGLLERESILGAVDDAGKALFGSSDKERVAYLFARAWEADDVYLLLTILGDPHFNPILDPVSPPPLLPGLRVDPAFAWWRAQTGLGRELSDLASALSNARIRHLWDHQPSYHAHYGGPYLESWAIGIMGSGDMGVEILEKVAPGTAEGIRKRLRQQQGGRP